MPDLTSHLLPQIHAHRIPGLALPEEFVHPNYRGLSILNIPNSICKILGAPVKNDIPALIPDVLAPLGDGTQKVLLILMDALALHRFQAWMASAPGLVWHRFLPEGILAPLTSIAPSTTSSALTSYWTASAPSSHGIIGYEMWLKEYGIVTNTILHTPMSFRSGGIGSLEKAGFSPEEFLPMKPIGPHLSAHGIESHVFQDHSIINSPLSRMFFDQANRHGTGGAVDLWHSVRLLWEQSVGEKLFAWIYWSEVDSLSHLHGPDDARIPAEFASFSQAFETMFLNRLSADQLKDTLLILTADHGQIATNREDEHYNLRNHPDFTRRLHILPTCENRMVVLYPKPGQVEAVREYIERTWPNQFTLLESAYAIEKGLLGPGDKHPSLIDRAGDLIALAHGQAYWWWGAKPNTLSGRHGGLSREEMLVPFLAARF